VQNKYLFSMMKMGQLYVKRLINITTSLSSNSITSIVLCSDKLVKAWVRPEALLMTDSSYKKKKFKKKKKIKFDIFVIIDNLKG
jgi:hypothetical protein